MYCWKYCWGENCNGCHLDNTKVNNVGSIDDIVNDDIFEDIKNKSKENDHRNNLPEFIDISAIMENVNEKESTSVELPNGWVNLIAKNNISMKKQMNRHGTYHSWINMMCC